LKQLVCQLQHHNQHFLYPSTGLQSGQPARGLVHWRALSQQLHCIVAECKQMLHDLQKPAFYLLLPHGALGLRC
jgi:hypothetical protein